MKLQRILLFIILFLNIYVLCEDNEQEEFVATHEWQVIKKGQKIPKGLHVQINIKTGVKQAKLIDENESDIKQDKRALLEIPQDEEDNKLLDTDVIKEALKKLKADEVSSQTPANKFCSYEELKKDLEEINIKPKLDTEILDGLFKQYKDEIEKETLDYYALYHILEDFEFLAHQFDNALHFVKYNGFQEVIYRNLNLTDSKVREESLKLFGSLVQNNAKVQIHALETGAVGILLRILSLETSVDIKSKAIFALSCLIRRFPLAQLRFIENGGISVIMKIIENDPIKIQMKLVTLLNDVIIENQVAFREEDGKYREMLVSQYKVVNLKKLLLEQSWCLYLNKLILSLVAIDPNDYDSIERCMIAMHTVQKECAGHFNRNVLLNLQARYKDLIKTDSHTKDDSDDTDIFSNLLDICRFVLYFIIVILFVLTFMFSLFFTLVFSAFDEIFGGVSEASKSYKPRTFGIVDEKKWKKWSNSRKIEKKK